MDSCRRLTARLVAKGWLPLISISVSPAGECNRSILHLGDAKEIVSVVAVYAKRPDRGK